MAVLAHPCASRHMNIRVHVNEFFEIIFPRAPLEGERSVI